MSRLRLRKLTPAQERALEESERLMARSQIYRAGVKESLSSGYPGPYDLEISIAVLEDARHLEQQARVKQKILNTQPGKAKRANAATAHERRRRRVITAGRKPGSKHGKRANAVLEM